MPKYLRIPFIVAAVLWMALIFSFSMETAAESSGSSDGFIRTFLSFIDDDFESLSPEAQTETVESLSHLVRKTAHFCIFGMLGILVSSAISTYNLAPRRTLLCSVSLCALYAVSDEVHQFFVPGRACMIRDMLLDTCGALCGVLFVMLVLHLVSKHRNKRRL